MDRYPGGLPKSFLHPCLLLLLKEQPGYGYDLVTRLKALGIDDDSAAVYRGLRTLEEKGSVYSYWNTSSAGPARRMYRLTPAGEEQLQVSVEGLAETHLAIERYLCRHALAKRRAAEPAGDESPPMRPGPAGLTALRRSVR